MHVISRKRLREFWESPGRQDAEEPLRAWFACVEAAVWPAWNDVKREFPKADWIGKDRAKFDIGGNKYRLVVKLEFDKQRMFIRSIGAQPVDEGIKDISNT